MLSSGTGPQARLDVPVVPARDWDGGESSCPALSAGSDAAAVPAAEP